MNNYRNNGGRNNYGSDRRRPHIPAPDQAAFDNDIAAINSRIEELTADMRVIESTQKQNAAILREAYSKNRERHHTLKPMLAEIAKLKAKKARYISEVVDKVREIKEVKAKSGQRGTTGGASSSGQSGGGPPEGARRIEEQIRRLERRQQTENMTLNAEKALVKELSALRMAMVKNKTLDQLYSEKRALQKAVDEVKAQLQSGLAALDDARDELNKDGIAHHIKEIRNQRPMLENAYRKTRQQIDDARREKKERYDAHFEAKRIHKRLLDEYYEEQRAAQKMERARAKAEEEERRKLEQEELEKQKPWQEEIKLCDLLINFCKRYAPAVKAVSNLVTKTQPGAAKVDTTGLGQKMSKKTGNGRYSKKKAMPQRGRKAQAKVAKVVRVTNTPATFSIFRRLRVAAPKLSTDILATIMALREKKAFFDVLPRNGDPNPVAVKPIAAHGTAAPSSNPDSAPRAAVAASAQNPGPDAIDAADAAEPVASGAIEEKQDMSKFTFTSVDVQCLYQLGNFAHVRKELAILKPFSEYVVPSKDSMTTGHSLQNILNKQYKELTTHVDATRSRSHTIAAPKLRSMLHLKKGLLSEEDSFPPSRHPDHEAAFFAQLLAAHVRQAVKDAAEETVASSPNNWQVGEATAFNCQELLNVEVAGTPSLQLGTAPAEVASVASLDNLSETELAQLLNQTAAYQSGTQSRESSSSKAFLVLVDRSNLEFTVLSVKPGNVLRAQKQWESWRQTDTTMEALLKEFASTQSSATVDE